MLLVTWMLEAERIKKKMLREPGSRLMGLGEAG